MADEPIKIFYSWQSWTPSARNKEFIEETLAQALEHIEQPNDRAIVIDRDTKDLPGIPAIADSILKKIEQCDIFLADVTIVLKSNEYEAPNPNVMLELGYAIHCLGLDRIILVMNKSLGVPKSLPFDLQHRRWPLTYELKSGDVKAKERDQLIGGLKGAIETILHRGLPSVGESITDSLERYIEQGNHISLDKLLRNQIIKLNEKIGSDEFFTERKNLIENHRGEQREIWAKGFDLYFRKCQFELRVFLSLSWYGLPDQAKYIENALQQWMEEKSNDPMSKTSWKYVPSFFLLYLVGIATIANEKWSYLSALLLNNPSRHEYISSTTVYSFDLIAEGLIYHYQFDNLSNNAITGYAIGKYMQPILQPLFNFFLPLNTGFNNAFDIFEFIVALHHFDIRYGTELHNPLFLRYSSQIGYGDRSTDSIMSFLINGGQEGDNWNLLKQGLFGKSSQRFLKVLEAYQERLVKANNRYDFPLSSPDYVAAFKSGLSTK